MKIQQTVYQRYLYRLSTRHDIDCGYVFIPKNASTYLTHLLRNHLNWQMSFNYVYHKRKQYIVCLRDPMDRWYSGVAEYFSRCHKELFTKTPDKDLIDFIFERVYLDEHTLPQVDFLTGLNTENITFFKFGDDLSDNIKDFLIKNNWCEDVDLESLLTSRHYNRTSSNDLKKTWIAMLKSNMTEDVQKHIQHFYHKDYELFNSVEFYGTN